MQTLLLIAAAALLLKKKQSGIGRAPKRRIWHEVAAARDLGIDLEDGNWQWFEKELREVARRYHFKPSPRSQKPMEQQYYNSLSKAYKSIAGIGVLSKNPHMRTLYHGNGVWSESLADEPGTDQWWEFYDEDTGRYYTVADDITLVLFYPHRHRSQQEEVFTIAGDALENAHALLELTISNAVEREGCTRYEVYLDDDLIEYYDAESDTHDIYEVAGVGRTDLPHTDSFIRNDRGDVILEYHEYGSPESMFRDACNWLTDVAPHDPYWMIMFELATGRKLCWTAKKPKRGLKDIILATKGGLPEVEERKARKSYLNRNGYTPDAFAEHIWMEYGEYEDNSGLSYFSDYDAMAALQQITLTYTSVQQIRDTIMYEYLKAHKALPEQIRESEENDEIPF